LGPRRKGRAWVQAVVERRCADADGGPVRAQAVPDDAALAPLVEADDPDDATLAAPALSPEFDFAELSALAGLLAELSEPSEPFEPFESFEPSVLAAAPPFDAFAPPLLPLRKSVTYQPEPLSWKPAAVTCLENVSFPQAGHCVSGASLSFRSTSFS
jgi:hypothetical protein